MSTYCTARTKTRGFRTCSKLDTPRPRLNLYLCLRVLKKSRPTGSDGRERVSTKIWLFKVNHGVREISNVSKREREEQAGVLILFRDIEM